MMIVRFAALSAALLLAACQETGPGGFTQASTVSAGGVAVALLSLEGAPTDVGARLASAMAQQAQTHDIAVVTDSGGPRYKLKGYVSAYPAEGGTAIAWVWDVFDLTSRRAQRLSGTEIVKRSAADPWQALDDAALQAAAARAMNGVAIFLSGGAPAVATLTGAPSSQDVVGLAGKD